MFRLLFSGIINYNFSTTMQELEGGEASLLNTFRSDISLIFCFMLWSTRLRHEPPIPDTAHKILKHDELRSTSSDKYRNNGPLYSLRPPFFFPCPSPGCKHPSSVSVSFTYLSRGHIRKILLRLNFDMFYF